MLDNRIGLVSFEEVNKRLPGPDIIRSIAIILVLINHAAYVYTNWYQCNNHPVFLSLGIFGVDLFFVLSGFLIGGILLDLIEQPFSFHKWKVFFVRRWLRTMPAYYTWLAATIVFSTVFDLIIPWSMAEKYLLYYLTFTQNLAWTMVSFWYFPSWSLVVEEWFYFLVPIGIIVFFLCKITEKQAFFLVLAALVLFPFLFRIMTDVNPVNDKTALGWFDSIGYGVIAALGYRRSYSYFYKIRLSLFWVGLCILFTVWGQQTYSSVLISNGFMRVFTINIISVAYMLMMPYVMSLKWVPSFAQEGARRISNYSYSVYLTHFSVLYLCTNLRLRYNLYVWQAIVLSVLLTGVFSFLLWNCVEQPILKRRPKTSLQ